MQDNHKIIAKALGISLATETDHSEIRRVSVQVYNNVTGYTWFQDFLNDVEFFRAEQILRTLEQGGASV